MKTFVTFNISEEEELAGLYGAYAEGRDMWTESELPCVTGFDPSHEPAPVKFNEYESSCSERKIWRSMGRGGFSYPLRSDLCHPSYFSYGITGELKASQGREDATSFRFGGMSLEMPKMQDMHAYFEAADAEIYDFSGNGAPSNATDGSSSFRFTK